MAEGQKPPPSITEALTFDSKNAIIIKYNKIAQYVKVLEEMGTRAGEPFMKRIEGDIWELRPLQDRIQFAAMVGGKFVLLHTFIKRSAKTPDREKEQARRELKDYLERGGE